MQTKDEAPPSRSLDRVMVLISEIIVRCQQLTRLAEGIK